MSATRPWVTRSASAGPAGASSVSRPGRVRREQRAHRRLVELVAEPDRVGDAALGHQLQHDRHVAEGEVEVDQADPPGAAGGQRDGDVGGERGLAAAALGREDRDDPGVELRRRRRPRRRGTTGPICRETSSDRAQAASSPAGSLAATTSRTPARIASPSSPTSSRSRMQDHAHRRPGDPVLGRDRERVARARRPGRARPAPRPGSGRASRRGRPAWSRYGRRCRAARRTVARRAGGARTGSSCQHLRTASLEQRAMPPRAAVGIVHARRPADIWTESVSRPR